jgi:hypothetical protein
MYSENIHAHRKVIINDCQDTNGLNVHKSCDCLVNPVLARVIADCWSRA